MPKKHNMGIGHFIPQSISKNKYIKLKQKWDTKLAEIGLQDIEQSDDEGFVSPVFAANHGMSSNMASSHLMRKYSPEKAEFYRLCTIFLTCFDWSLLIQKTYPELKGIPSHQLKQLWSLHCDGKTGAEISNLLPPEWGIGRWHVRNLLRALRQISATFNRTDSRGGLYESDF